VDVFGTQCTSGTIQHGDRRHLEFLTCLSVLSVTLVHCD